MIKLLIVDDEENTRDGLREYMPWKKLGVDVVETAKNGLDALKIANKMEPDILLTDVKMPKMDGIELASRIRELFPECNIIFLSAYADKEYLKQAIQLKATSYIEKPVITKEIKSIILDTVLQCKNNTKKKAETIELMNSINESIPLVCQKVALELVKDHADVSMLSEKFHDVFSHFPFDGSYITAYISINWKSMLDNKTRDSIKQSILEFFSKSNCFNYPICLAGFNNVENIVLIVRVNDETYVNYTNNSFKQLLDKLMEISNGKVDFSIGMGLCVTNIGQISKSFHAAASASNMQFYEGANKVFNHSQISSNHFKIENDFYDFFRNCLDSDRKDEASELVKKLTYDAGILKDNNIDSIKNIYFNLILIIYKIAMDRGFIDIFSENEKKYTWQEIDKITFLSELSEYILSNIDAIFSRMEEKDAISRKTYEIMKYIRENYSNKELSIHSIARHSYLTPTYLCAFFKKNAGKTLNEYITEIRMEKAKELLKDSRLKLYEVANRVGLSGANYFSTLFKKYTGYIPSEFREKYYL